jgi:hypothetical protein
MDIQLAEYGVWRPVYKQHAYDKINFVKVPDQTSFAFEEGSRPKLGDRKPLAPVDDLPPMTVITHVLHKNGKLLVRGTTSDNGTVTKVFVNGHEARSLGANFAEWEATIDNPSGTLCRIEAHAVDVAGNMEKRPHGVVFKTGS